MSHLTLRKEPPESKNQIRELQQQLLEQQQEKQQKVMERQMHKMEEELRHRKEIEKRFVENSKPRLSTQFVTRQVTPRTQVG